MSKIPTPEECINILKKVCCSKKVINHCLAVRDIAVRIAKLANADVALVEAGALLHDIGRCRTHGIFHAIEGVRIAKKLKLPDEIVKIIERHIGAGLTKDEAKKLGLPVKDYLPITLEEKIVCHADNLINNNKKQKIEKQIEKALKKNQKEYAIRLVSLHKELSDICNIDLNDI